MPEKIKYKIAPQSKAPLISFFFTLISVILLCVVYWPIFVQYFAGDIFDGPEVGVLTVVFYGSLIAGLLLYGILTGMFAKKTLVPSAIFALVPSIFYILDISGLRNVILFFDANKTFSYYNTKIDYFSAAWPFIVALTLLTILSAVCYFMLSANRRHGFSATVIILNALAWLVFSVYYIVGFAVPELATKDITERDFAYTIMTNIAAVLYFASQFVVTVALRKAMPVAAPAEPALPVSADSDINLLQPTPSAETPVVEERSNFVPAVPLAELSATEENSIDIVISHEDNSEVLSLDASSPESFPEQKVPDEQQELDVTTISVDDESAELSDTDIEVLVAVDAGIIETAETDAAKDIKPSSKKNEPKKKSSAKTNSKPKKTAANTTSKSGKQKKDVKNEVEK